MGYRFSKGWNSKDDSWSTDGAAGSGCDASGTKSYHNGGVEGSSFAKWYDENLAGKFDGSDDGKGSGSGGTKGSGSGGTKGTGSGGTKGSGSGGTKGSDSGGTKGSGSGGTKGSGSGGTKGSGSGGTKGSGSGGTKGSGSGGTKGSGSGGTKGSGSGGTKGSGSGGTKGSGSGGTKGSGSCGTKGSGSGGTQGTDTGGDEKTTLNFTVGDPAEINVSVTETDTGTLFFTLSQVQFDGNEAEIDEVYFNLTDGSGVETLYFYPTAGSRDVSDIQAADDGVNGAGGTFDVGLKFDPAADDPDNGVKSTDFTLSSNSGSLSFEDIDLAGMRVVVDVDESGEGDVLGVTGGVDPLDADPDAADTSDGATALMDALSLASMPSEEDEEPDLCEDDAFDMA
ncbi:hypothetical protein [Sulfitobacter dubius]|uniref:hypothetical protein n=1 Tax=Sulfitobacter dubius TaxID=218673 RepID=UPI0022AE95C7|nr:hypothetical protein [Sulfitobacter dubius]MCZ4367643.1 hypothetical protein [Sulfitobacter dubius]